MTRARSTSKATPATRSSKKGGRPTKFTQARRVAILNALRGGAYLDQAAEKAGIHRDTLMRWLAQGERQETPDKARFFDQVYEAMAEAEQKVLDEHAKITSGLIWTERRVEKVPLVDADGNVVGEGEKVVEVYRRDPKAYQWFLERRWSSRWGRNQKVDVQGVIRVKRLELGEGSPDPAEAPIPRVEPPTDPPRA